MSVPQTYETQKVPASFNDLDEKGKYQPSKLFTLSEKVYSGVLPGFELNLDEVFED